jgi:hypothetical protein
VAAHEFLERASIEALGRLSHRVGVGGERGEVACVTLERVLGQSPLHAQMI